MAVIQVVIDNAIDNDTLPPCPALSCRRTSSSNARCASPACPSRSSSSRSSVARSSRSVTGESDPWKAAAKYVALIAEWKERIEQARNAAQDPLRARVEALTNAYRQYRNKALDDAGAALAMDVLVFALEREGGQLTTALARQPDARLALASPTIIDQITGHATPFLTHFKRWKEATHIKGDTLKMYVSDIEQFAATVDVPIEQLSRRHVKQWEESLRGKVTAETIRRKMTSVRAVLDLDG